MTATLAAPPKARHWILATGGALLLHAGIIVVFHQFVTGGAIAPGRGGIEIGLAPAGGAPGAPEKGPEPEVAAGSETATAAAVPPAAAAEVAPEPVEDVAPETPRAREPGKAAEAVPAETAAVVPVNAMPVIPPEAVPLSAPEETVAAVVETLEPHSMEIPVPPKQKPPPREAAAAVTHAKAPTVPDTPAQPAGEAEEGSTAMAVGPRDGAPAASELLGNGGKAGAGARGATGTAQGHSGGGAPGAFVDYAAQIRAWLEKHKEYPRRARLRRQEGVAKLYFVIDRSGRVLEYRILESTGYKLLDEEVAAMIERASPLPEPPSALTGNRLDYAVPVEFKQY